MYSPGQFYLRVPRERSANLRFRLYVLRRCRQDVRFRQALLWMCKADLVFFVNVFVWQYNPNAIGRWSEKVGPFITAPFQDRTVRSILDCICGRKDLVIEKSREMGASWLCLIVMVWFLLFHENESFLCISRNKEAVDEPTRNSLFAKIDYILGHLPEWMATVGEGKINRRVMSFVNEENGTEITGQATTRKSGVGGRATAIFIDEFAQIDQDWQILERTASTSGCRIFNSTHLGTNTAFYELATKVTAARHCVKIVLHWTLHPDKNRGGYRYDAKLQRTVHLDPEYRYPADFCPVTDGNPTGGPHPGLRSPWYDMMCEKIGNSRGVAADLDINPSGSQEQVFNPLMLAELTARYAKRPYGEYELEWFKDDATPRRLHRHPGGKIWLWTHTDPEGKPPAGRYVFGADVATGNGASPSCLSGADARTGEKVFEYTDAHIEPKDLAYLMAAVGRLFRDEEGRVAKLVWETPGPGNTVSKHLMALYYENIYFRRTDLRMKKEISDTPGWPNAPESLKLLIGNYKNALRDGRFLNRSEAALSECLDFVYNPDGDIGHTGWKDTKDPSAARHNHGDHVIADALCWKLVDEMGLGGVFSEKSSEASVAQLIPTGGLAWRQALHRMQAQDELP